MTKIDRSEVQIGQIIYYVLREGEEYIIQITDSYIWEHGINKKNKFICDVLFEIRLGVETKRNYTTELFLDSPGVYLIDPVEVKARWM